MRLVRPGTTIATLAATALFSMLPALAAPAETPEAFVRRIYAKQYRDNGPGVSTDRPKGAAFFTAELLDQFAKDSELAHGEVGAIDQDPVCDCQDWGKLKIKQLTVAPAEAGAVKARVDLTNLGEAYTLTLTLQPTPAGWRIADVGSKDTASLLAYIKNANAHPVQDPPASDAKPAPPKP